MRAHDEPKTVDLGPGQTIDTVDQVSSVVLLGVAMAGSAVSLLILSVV